MKAIKDKIAKDVAKTVEPGIYPDQKDIEAKLLAVLKAPETTKDAKRYICR